MNEQSWRKVWAIWMGTRNLPASQRRSYAESAVNDNEQLQEVLAMLESEQSIRLDADSFFDAASRGPAENDWPLIGKNFGRFVITAPLGRGGMGEVYRALDTELNRTVAIKFLASGDARTDEAVSRFVREAQAASALNHPNIVTIYDVLHTTSAVGIVMELIEGVSLRTLCGTPLPVVDVIRWGHQIALALSAAHGAGIIHRDIKPENLILRPDGFVKVLDFGLARQIESTSTNSSTLDFVGTLRYMSPEQVHRQRPLPPSDIFTLGIVLYELATGAYPFATEFAMAAGKSAASSYCDALLVPYAITTSDPVAPSKLQPSIPPELDTLVLAMLQRHPARRPDAAAVANQILAIQNRPVNSKQRRLRLALALTTTLIILLLIAFLYWPHWKSAARPLAPVVIEGEPLTSSPGDESNPAFSPSGQQIAYAWDGGSDTRERSIYVRLLDGGNPLRLTNGANDDNPVWSPDGTAIAFLRYSTSGAQVMIVPALGGALRVVAPVADARLTDRKLLAWSTERDELIVADNAHPPAQGHLRLCRLNINSGQEQNLTSPPEGEDDMEPVLSPDRRRLAFLRRGGSEYQIYVISDAAVPPRRVTSAKDVHGLTWWADSRTLSYSTNEAIGHDVHLVSERGGESAPAPFQFGSGVRDLTISPGGGWIAFVHEEKDTNIWAKSDKDSAFHPLIASTRADEDARISPDGTQIAFTSNRSGKFEIWVCDRDGSNPHVVTSQRTFAGSSAWSPDGHTLAYDSAVGGGPTEIWLLNAQGGQPRRLLPPPLHGFIPNWSADGASIYFVGEGLQIWKAPVAGGPPVQITRNGGLEGFETPDGKYLYFAKGVMTPGIWRLPTAGGNEELVPELAIVNPFRSWALTRDGIYYVESEPKPVLKVWQFGSRKTRTVTSLPKPPQRAERGLSVSADGRLILYLQVDTIRSEIMLAQMPH